MYALVTATCLLFLYGIAAKKRLIGAIGLVLSINLFYGSFLFLVSCFLYLLAKRRFREFASYLLLFTISVVILLPLLTTQLQNARSVVATIAGWKSVLGLVTAKNLLLIPLKFTTGRMSFDPKIAYYVLGIISVIFVWYGSLRGLLKDKMLFFIVSCVLFLGILVSFIIPMLQYFRYIYLVPLVMAGVAIGYKNMLLRIGVALILLLWSLAYVALPQFHREDWKSLARSLSDKVTVYCIPSSLDALRYYKKDIKIYDFRTMQQSNSTVFVIPYTFEIYGITINNLKTVESFRGGLSVASWKKVRDN